MTIFYAAGAEQPVSIWTVRMYFDFARRGHYFPEIDCCKFVISFIKRSTAIIGFIFTVIRQQIQNAVQSAVLGISLRVRRVQKNNASRGQGGRTLRFQRK